MPTQMLYISVKLKSNDSSRHKCSITFLSTLISMINVDLKVVSQFMSTYNGINLDQKISVKNACSPLKIRP